MPLYDYACTSCGRIHEVRHGFNETYESPCESCGAPVRRVFNAAPVLFKGSGFYVTDSRRPAERSKADKSDKPDKPDKSKTEAAKPNTDSAKPDSVAKPDKPASSESAA
jgi:putative FmdB family regulatory protein